MLDDRDIQMISQLIAGSEERMTQRLEASEKRMADKLEERILETERILLDEIARTQNHLETRIGKLQQNMDDMQRYYRITKIEDNVTSLLFDQVASLTKRVDALEQREMV